MIFARRLARALLLLGLLAAAAPAASAEESPTSPAEAAKFIQELGSRAVALFASYKPSEAAKSEEEFKQIFRDGFDLDLIGRFVLGNSWRTASPEQKEQYRTLFETWVLNTYTRRIGAYRGETFRVTGEQPIAETDALVETEIDRAEGPPLKAGWRVRNIQGQMKIIDVVVEGISMALTQRQEFASVIQHEGLDGLLRELKTKVDNLKAASSGN
ncbi:MAG TPA: ABC transporter substrate-binding protein [Alphaproteobacteria bacterium]|nr:ABC transporter substrate-binding protein [Alphaproteobacteria bacterium]